MQAIGFTTIELINNGSDARLIFEMADGTEHAVEMPINVFELGISEMLRIVESARQQRDANIGGFQQISFSTVQTIEPRADVTVGRVYLVIDRGMPHQVAYGLRLLDASRLALAIYTEIEKWLVSAQPPDVKQ